MLIATFRKGAIADILTHSVRLLQLVHGESMVDALLADYIDETAPQLYPGDEAIQFASWLGANGPQTPYLEDMLAIEAGIVRIAAGGRAGEISLSHDHRADHRRRERPDAREHRGRRLPDKAGLGLSRGEPPLTRRAAPVLTAGGMTDADLRPPRRARHRASRAGRAGRRLCAGASRPAGCSTFPASCRSATTAR